MWTVARLARELAEGKTSSRELLEQALARIADPAGEGARAYIKVYGEAARAEAEHADRLRRAGIVRSPVDGLPVSVKDLYDVGGDVTRAGSKLLAGAPPATADAPAVARLRAAGAVIVGRTNMVEFAFGTTGLNPHYGTPKNPWDRKTGRVPGGSSSGAAVAVADGMCVMGLGSDTRGSIRHPAALCGITGWKPTQRRVPREGAFPLSYTLDTVGPLANTVACCAAYDAVLADAPAAALPELPAKGLRLLLPRSMLLDDLDADVGRAFAAALSKLAAAGAVITERAVPEFDRQGEYFKLGGFAGAEAFAIHRRWRERRGEYDPRIAQRLDLAGQMSAADFVDLGLLRTGYMRAVEALAAPFDAVLMPTTPCVAPPIAEVGASDEAYFRWNARFLRNVGIVNFLDGCAVSLPCHEPGAAPVGLSVFGPAMSDARILAAAAALEKLLRPLV
ncbi:MAG: amidase [Betaproteobacteria bacterium]|nr:amidase [Betaproteobacteria bacterium]MDH5577272.1 amidase [Betaproteobacteria bacterium]